MTPGRKRLRRVILLVNGLSIAALFGGVASSLAFGQGPIARWSAFVGFIGALVCPFLHAAIQVKRAEDIVQAHEDECGEYKDRIKSLEAENERLRGVVDRIRWGGGM